MFLHFWVAIIHILSWQQEQNTSISISVEVIHLILGSRTCGWLCDLLFPSHCCLVWFQRRSPASIKVSLCKRVGLRKRGLMVKKCLIFHSFFAKEKSIINKTTQPTILHQGHSLCQLRRSRVHSYRSLLIRLSNEQQRRYRNCREVRQLKNKIKWTKKSKVINVLGGPCLPEHLSLSLF